MNSPVSIGVIGCGYWGPNLIRNLRTIDNCSVRIMCDLNRNRLKHLQALYSEIEATTDYEEVVRNPDLDAIVVATPVSQHFPLAKAALLAGKHTFIEKPMASSSAECKELIVLAERRGLVLMVGHTFLYSAAIRKIKEIVDSGDLGEIRYINCRRLNLGLFQKDINVAWDLAPHDISIILYILGELPTSVNCQGNAHVTAGIEDVTNISLSCRSKRFATIQSSWLEPRKVREMTIVGTRRMIVYDDLEPNEKIRVYDVRVERPPHYDTFAEFQYSYHYGDIYIPHLHQEEPLRSLSQHFIDCIVTGAKPNTGGEQGLELVQILEAASASLRANGSPVFLTPTSPGSNGLSTAGIFRPVVQEPLPK